MFTINATEARGVTQQVKPRVAIPKHYWWEGAIEDSIRDQPRVRKLGVNGFDVSKSDLPPPTEILVLSSRETVR
jgi:hypothetical protein